jgi:hypothetical protein
VAVARSVQFARGLRPRSSLCTRNVVPTFSTAWNSFGFPNRPRASATATAPAVVDYLKNLSTQLILSSQTQSYITTDGQTPSLSRCQEVIWDQRPISLLFPKLFLHMPVSWCGAPYMTRGQVCSLKLRLGLASAVSLGFQSRRSNDHTLVSQIWDFPNLEGQVPVFYPPGTG